MSHAGNKGNKMNPNDKVALMLGQLIIANEGLTARVQYLEAELAKGEGQQKDQAKEGKNEQLSNAP